MNTGVVQRYCYFAADSAKAKAGLEAVGASQGPIQIKDGQGVDVDGGRVSASDWNAAGITFEERDYSNWAQDRIKDVCYRFPLLWLAFTVRSCRF